MADKIDKAIADNEAALLKTKADYEAFQILVASLRQKGTFLTAEMARLEGAVRELKKVKDTP